MLPNFKTTLNLKRLWGGGHSNISVVHMCNQRKKRLFSETEHDSQELRLEVKVWLFSRKKSLSSLRGAFRGHFSNSLIPQTVFPPKKKSCLGGKIVCETVQNSCLGCFSSEGQISIRVCFENLGSQTCATRVFEYHPTPWGYSVPLSLFKKKKKEKKKEKEKKKHKQLISIKSDTRLPVHFSPSSKRLLMNSPSDN